MDDRTEAWSLWMKAALSPKGQARSTIKENMKILLSVTFIIIVSSFTLRAEPSSAHKALAEAAQHAVAKGNTDLLSALLKAGLQIDEPIDEEGYTLLHWSTAYNELRSAHFLMQNGADPHVRNNHGDRPIDKAYDDNQLEMCKALAVGTEEDYMLDEIIPNSAVEELLADIPTETNLVFVVINQSDPSEVMDGWIDYKWSNWRPYSDATTLTQQQFYDENAPSMHKCKSTGQYGKMIHIDTKRISKDKYEYHYRWHTGPLGGGGATGIIIRKYGYWIKVKTSSWIS